MNDEFPHTVTFQKKTRTPDGHGGYTETYNDFLTTEALVDPLSGTERYQAMQMQSPVNSRIYYPYQEGVTADMRAFWVDRDKTLEVKSDPIDQGGQGEIMKVEVLEP